MDTAERQADEFEPDEEADRRFEETVRQMAKMPPKPQEEMKLGKPRRRGAAPAPTYPSSDRRSEGAGTRSG
jgi:hypothetical protein